MITIMLIFWGKVYILAYLFMFQFSYTVGYSCPYRGSTAKAVYVKKKKKTNIGIKLQMG